MCCHPAFMLSCLCVINEVTIGRQPSFKDCPGVRNQICHRRNMPLLLSKGIYCFTLCNGGEHLGDCFTFRFIAIPFLATVLLKIFTHATAASMLCLMKIFAVSEQSLIDRQVSCSLCSHHCIIMKFSGVINNDQSEFHAKGQGQRSKVKVTEVKTQLSHFWTVTPVLIRMWWWSDAQSLMLLRRSVLLFFKVIHQISRSYGPKKIVDFDPNWAFLDCNSSLNSPVATKWCTKLEVA